MTEYVEVIAPEMSIQEAAEQMRSLGVGVLPVCNGDRLVGLLTDRDLAVRAVAEAKIQANIFLRLRSAPVDGKDMKKLPLEERKATLQRLLKKPPGVIRYSATLGNNAKDLLKEARKLGLEGLIGKRAKSVYERVMEKNQIRRLPVLDHDNRIVGIVSLGDLAIKDDENRAGVTLERVSEHSRSALGS